MFLKVVKYIKAAVLMPYYIFKMYSNIQEISASLKQPMYSPLGRALIRDHNIMFKYATSGIELHPFVKRESDALVADFREANNDAQVRYALAAEFVRKGSDILDLSCGYGYGTDFLFRSCAPASAVGADRFPPAIEYANRVFGSFAPCARFAVHDALDPDGFADNSFDFIISLETVEHIQDDSLLLSNFQKWLRANGRLIISVPNENKMPFSPEKHPYHCRHYTIQQLEELAARSGFVVEEFRFFDGGGVSATESYQIFVVMSVKGPM